MMEWFLANPQFRSTFSSLGSLQPGNTYQISANCLEILDEINCKLLVEDHTLRTFRRAIGFGQYIKKDLMPLLMCARDTRILDSTIRILVNLTVPVECLLSIEVMSRTEGGRTTIFELNRLLITSKEAFTEPKSTKAILDFMKKILEREGKLSLQQCDSLNNCLLLLRNILHIPETSFHHEIAYTSLQNQIVWNIFTQSIDKLLIHLMSCSQRAFWGVTMVQVIALMYKDQHINTLQKLLHICVEASLSDSSEDNESNTTPPKQCSGDSSPMLSSDPTSDSSDNGDRTNATSATQNKSSDSKDSKIMAVCTDIVTITQKQALNTNSDNQTVDILQNHNLKALKFHLKPGTSKQFINLKGTDATFIAPIKANTKALVDCVSLSANEMDDIVMNMPATCTLIKCAENLSSQSEFSDCGYGTQMENQESISTSSNEEGPVHHKPPVTQKQRLNNVNKQRNVSSVQDKKNWHRKKMVKRSRSSLINVKGLLGHVPSDTDISMLLKEFTVDFLLKGYGSLVQELYAQLLNNFVCEIDTSHFFWLVTYFLRFATQLELDFDHINVVLSYDILSYLTYEGVNLCEHLELASRKPGSDLLEPCLRRMHLVVTAIREFLQAVDTYKKISHLTPESKQHLQELQLQIAATDDLRGLFVLLLRRYNPTMLNKQYLKDVIVTNHILLHLLDDVTKFPEYRGTFKVYEHIGQFVTFEIMHNYGLLLEDFRENGEFVNDCIFTMMHHIGGDLSQASTLFQPVILKSFSQIWEAEFELCDDWSDLVEYVIHKVINSPQKSLVALPNSALNITESIGYAESPWTQQEIETLCWYYVQSKKSPDLIGNIIKQFKDNGDHYKSRLNVIRQLFQQDIIAVEEFEHFMKAENVMVYVQMKRAEKKQNSIIKETNAFLKMTTDKPIDDIQVLCDQLIQSDKGKMLLWVQKLLLECCFVKINIQINSDTIDKPKNDCNKIMEPIPHHYIMKNQSVPLVPWNADQTAILHYQPFTLLLHKIGLQLPIDVGKLFVRVPNLWSANTLYEVAMKLGPIDNAILKFNVSQLQDSLGLSGVMDNFVDGMQSPAMDNFTIARSRQTNSIIRYTPDPITPTHQNGMPSWLQIVMRSQLPSNQSESNCLAAHVAAAVEEFQLSPLLSVDTENASVETNATINDDRSPDIDDTIECYDEQFVGNYETESVASALERMHVSDEEDIKDDMD